MWWPWSVWRNTSQKTAIKNYSIPIPVIKMYKTSANRCKLSITIDVNANRKSMIHLSITFYKPTYWSSCYECRPCIVYHHSQTMFKKSNLLPAWARAVFTDDCLTPSEAQFGGMRLSQQILMIQINNQPAYFDGLGWKCHGFLKK